MPVEDESKRESHAEHTFAQSAAIAAERYVQIVLDELVHASVEISPRFAIRVQASDTSRQMSSSHAHKHVNKHR